MEGEKGGQLLLSDVLNANNSQQSESDCPCGPLIIAIKPHCCDQSEAVGHILGQVDPDGFVSLVEESIMGARQWVAFFNAADMKMSAA